MTPIPTWSKSQIEAFDQEAGGCNRLWAWDKIARVPRIQDKSAALGSEIHKQLENYLLGGVLDYAAPSGSGYIAAAGLHHNPQPLTPGMEIEKSFKFQSLETGFFYTGIIDLLFIHGPRGWPLIQDHKSISSLRYAKTEQQLWYDPQAIIYAKWLDAEETDLKWVYYQTKGARKSIVVETSLLKPHVDTEFAKIELTTRDMSLILEASRGVEDKERFVLGLPYNPDRCKKYNGCPYQHKCQLGPMDALISVLNRDKRPTSNSLEELMTQGLNSLIAQIKQDPNAPPAAFNPGMQAMQPQQPPQQQVPFQPQGQPQYVQQPQQYIQQPPQPQYQQPAAPYPQQYAQPQINSAPQQAPQGQTIVVDHGPQHGQDRFHYPPPDQAGINPPPAQIPAAEPVQVPPQAMTAPVQAEKPKKEPKPKAVKAAPTVEATAVPVQEGYTLFIDCLPSNYVEFDFSPIKQALCQNNNVADYRLIDFGKGAGFLAALTEQYIQQVKPTGNIFVSTHSHEVLTTLATLVKYATSVVRAVR